MYSVSMQIKQLLFDMDNTLYPEASLIDKNLTHRILSFVSSFFSVSIENAIEKRKEGLTRHGTTLEWLLTEHGLKDTKSYFEFLHPSCEKEEVDFDPNLRPFLLRLKEHFHLTVLTNAPTIHANCILNHLQVYDLFEGIYDLEDNNFLGKPHKEAYLMAIEKQGFSIEETLFFDDHPKYIKGFSDIGGKGILIDLLDRYNKEDIEKCNAFAKIKTIYEIPSLLKNAYSLSV